jgi:hypothetical protein
MFELKEPPSVRKRIPPERYALMGRVIIGFGVVASAAGYGYMLHGGMTPGMSLISVLPLLGIFTAIGWSYARMGQDGVGIMAGYLSGCVALCALIVAWLTGK